MSAQIKMSMTDMLAITNAFATVMREYVEESINERLQPIEKALEQFPKKGERGEPGRDGQDGTNGLRGEKGERGAEGKDGRDGRDGQDGEPGRDALEQLDILTFIDETKSYPRGTLASHKNGIWQAKHLTDGMEGWACLLAGQADISIVQTDERNFAINFLRTDGQQDIFEFSLPVVIDRGVFRKGTPYKNGDGVTCNGSFWIAQDDTSEVPGEGVTSWRLAIKKGRDGKDGIQGPKGDQGPSGRDGKDLTQLGNKGEKW